MRTEASKLAFWGQWVAANLVGELAGLGIVGAVGSTLVRIYGEPVTAGAVLVYAALAVALGAVEGAIVGYAQAGVLRRRLPGLRSWVAATTLGAAIAWALGMLPSTLISLYRPPGPAPAPAPDIPDGLQLLLAMPLGVVAGAILAFPQWRILRRHLAHAGWWIAANALAWALAMPLVFVAAGVRPETSAAVSAVIVVASLAAAGAVAGAVHGAYLVRLLERLQHRLARRAQATGSRA